MAIQIKSRNSTTFYRKKEFHDTNITLHTRNKSFWYPTYNQNGYPHVQQAFLLPPERQQEFDPFILLAEDWFKRGVFGDHPHRGFQTVTYVVDGRLEHIDNAGGYSILDAGDIQVHECGMGSTSR